MRFALACMLALAALGAHAESPARNDVLKRAARVADWQLARQPMERTFDP